MSTWIDPHVFHVAVANLAHLKGGLNVAVDVVLLFADFDVLLGCYRNHRPHVDVFQLAGGILVGAVCSAVYQGLVQRLALRDRLHNLVGRGDKPDGPLPEPSAAQTEDVAARLLLELPKRAFDLVVRDKGAVARVLDCNHLFVCFWLVCVVV